MCIKGTQARRHAGTHAYTPTVAKLPLHVQKKPRSLTLVLDSFVPSARVMDREKIFKKINKKDSVYDTWVSGITDFKMGLISIKF